MGQRPINYFRLFVARSVAKVVVGTGSAPLRETRTRSQRGHSYIITATFVCHTRISDCDIQTVGLFFSTFSMPKYLAFSLVRWCHLVVDF